MVGMAGLSQIASSRLVDNVKIDCDDGKAQCAGRLTRSIKPGNWIFGENAFGI